MPEFEWDEEKKSESMNIQAINQKAAIELLKKGKSIDNYQVQFDEEKVESLDAMLLRKHGVPIPDDLVYYDDDNIDFSDDPEI